MPIPIFTPDSRLAYCQFSFQPLAVCSFFVGEMLLGPSARLPSVATCTRRLASVSAPTRSGENSRGNVAALAALQRDRGGVLHLIGHASTVSTASDPAEGAEINRRLAQRRAESTAAELRRLGLTADQIDIGSEGAQAPAYDEATPLGEAGNRRVEIYLEL